ncbi:MAG: hypothetical protein K5753_02675 [Clostridia bacterium]|nr:hypothetical protein [Clostridia bacterium]
MNKKLAIVVLLVLALVLAVGLSACQENGNPLEIPEYVVPTIGATYGQTLADIALPAGFSWQDDASTSVGAAGRKGL